MPSSVKKKRKAAKKKQKQDPELSLSTGDEDFKTQNGTSSESREVNGTYDHHHKCPNQLDVNNNKLDKKDYNASPVLSTVEEDKSLDRETIQGNQETVHELGFDDNGVVEVENDLTSAKNNAGRSISSEYIEPRKKFDERDDESSSSSSVEEFNISDKKTEAYNFSYKTNECDDKPDKPLPATIGINEFASVGECINSLVETMVSYSVKSEVPVSIEKICLTEVAAGEKLVVFDAVTSGLKDDANTLLSNQFYGTRASSFSNIGLLPKENEDKVIAVTTESSQVSSSMMKQGSKYLEGKTFSSSVSPAVGASKDDVATKDSEIPKCSKNHSLASAPIVAQRTSIFNCCGLIDLLRSSN